MAGHAVRGAALAALACLGAEDALAQTAGEAPFLDTKSMGMHAKAGPPPIIPMKDLLTAPAENQFRQERVAKPVGAAATVAEAARPFKLAAGHDGAGNVKTVAMTAAMRDAVGFVSAGARYDHAQNYEDGNGDKIDYGYKRDSQQLALGWTPNADTTLRLSGIRDYIADDIQAHYSQDAPITRRMIGKAVLSRKNAFGLFETLDTSFTLKDTVRQADNYSLRAMGAQRMLMDIERQGYEAASVGTFRAGPALNTVGIELGYDRHDAQRISTHNSPDAISAYRFPDVETQSASLYGDSAIDITADDRLKLGLRYDFLMVSANDVHKRGSSSTAALNVSPQSLYTQYYGVTDNDAEEHNFSGRARYERDVLADQVVLFGDLSRMVRTADNIERYHAVPAQWVGNPQIAPEKHNKAQLGAVFTSPAHAGYGRMKPDAGPSVRLSASGWYDRVQDFITGDRARLQPGILVNNNAVFIYRNVEAQLAGAEIDGQWNITRNWSTRANLAYTHGRNLTDGRPLYQIPPLEATLLLDYQDQLGGLGTWNLGARLRMVASQDRVDSDRTTGFAADTGGRSSGFAVLDLHGGVQVNDRIALMAGIDNLLDQTYAEHLTGLHVEAPDKTPLNAPGRTAFVRGVVNF
jgi:iron complex outermembrane receptor protein